MKKINEILIYIFVFGIILIFHYCLVSWSWGTLSKKTYSNFIKGIVVESSSINIVQWDNKEKFKKYLSDSEYVFVHGHFIENQIELYLQYAEFRKIHHNLESQMADGDTWKIDDKPIKIWEIDCVSVGEMIQQKTRNEGERLMGSYKVCINGLEASIVKVPYSNELLIKKPLDRIIKINSSCFHLGCKKPFISEHQLRIIVDGLKLM